MTSFVFFVALLCFVLKIFVAMIFVVALFEFHSLT